MGTCPGGQHEPHAHPLVQLGNTAEVFASLMNYTLSATGKELDSPWIFFTKMFLLRTLQGTRHQRSIRNALDIAKRIVHWYIMLSIQVDKQAGCGIYSYGLCCIRLLAWTNARQSGSRPMTNPTSPPVAKTAAKHLQACSNAHSQSAYPSPTRHGHWFFLL